VWPAEASKTDDHPYAAKVHLAATELYTIDIGLIDQSGAPSEFHVKRTNIAQNIARSGEKPIFVLF
jgi:hypothetical protein